MQRPRGTKDIFGELIQVRKIVFKILEDVSETFNVQKIETPIFEKKDVFQKTVGVDTDIVQKEMYTFIDKNNREMVLRPEGTSGIIRAVIENKLYAQAMPLKLYYLGQMFRYENPQKGRQRQFSQYGVEFIGDKSPFLDAEIILLAVTILDALKVKSILKINFLGSKFTRENWSQSLTTYFKKHSSKLEPISVKRIDQNPLRILDDKIESSKKIIKNAPTISDFYSQDEKQYFQKLCLFLEKLGIKFKIDHKLVRGLDYYTDTVFEFVSKSKSAGSQATIIGGGRYDNLVAQMGGPNLSGIGFGLGVERIVNDLSNEFNNEKLKRNLDIYVMNIKAETSETALGIVYMLRKSGLKVAWNYKPSNINKAFAKADKAKALLKVIVGPQELANASVIVKRGHNQSTVKIDDLIAHINKNMGEIHGTNE